MFHYIDTEYLHTLYICINLQFCFLLLKFLLNKIVYFLGMAGEDVSLRSKLVPPWGGGLDLQGGEQTDADGQ